MCNISTSVAIEMFLFYFIFCLHSPNGYPVTGFEAGHVFPVNFRIIGYTPHHHPNSRDINGYYTTKDIA